MSEIGGCSCLQAYLNSAPSTYSVLVIDTTCVLDAPLYIPPGRTVRGCGIYGAGILSFTGLSASTPAITMGSPYILSLETALEDIQISRAVAVNATNGVAVSINGDRCVLRNVRINNSYASPDFLPRVTVGVGGTASARNVVIDHIQIIGAVIGISAVGPNWRIRHPFIRDSLTWGIDVAAPNVLIESGRFENNGDPSVLAANQRGAIRTSSSGTVVLHNYLEQNGWNYDQVNQVLLAPGTAVCIHPNARRARLIANFLAADTFAFDLLTVDKAAQGPDPYPWATLFSGDPPAYAATPELLPLLAEGFHTLAFNTIDNDASGQFYPTRALLTASLNASIVELAP